MIFTTNKPLSEWGKVLHDEDLAAAILDRVLERGRFIQLDGPSGRTRNLNLEEVWPAAAERLRISGINGSEFPERTACFSVSATLRMVLSTLNFQRSFVTQNSGKNLIRSVVNRRRSAVAVTFG
ncbi:MAG: ATP-binding protein [Acidobacteria bacterium]|nr:ATP-binding protein [Acidobacteriota bacterium]